MTTPNRHGLLQVTCLARSTAMAYNYDGLDINRVPELLTPGSDGAEASDLL